MTTVHGQTQDSATQMAAKTAQEKESRIGSLPSTEHELSMREKTRNSSANVLLLLLSVIKSGLLNCSHRLQSAIRASSVSYTVFKHSSDFVYDFTVLHGSRDSLLVRPPDS